MKEIYVGIISGTSLDGVDLALVEIATPFAVRLLHYACEPFEEALRHHLLALMSAEAETWDRWVAAHRVLGEVFAEALVRFLATAGVGSGAVVAAGFHGVTCRHVPDWVAVLGQRGRGTLQLGDPHLLASRAGVPVVFDFRHADMALGGQGAPLAPFLDHMMFRLPGRRRIMLNLGGIANLTYLAPEAEAPLAFDTGPANMIIDSLMRCHPTAPRGFDAGGAYAARGRVLGPLLDACLAHAYFREPPPKSTGRELFGEAFSRRFLDWSPNAAHEDLVATATRLTAVTVADAVRSLIAPPYRDGESLIVSGGGAHNRVLLSLLAELVPGLTVETTAAHGLDPDAKEAVLLAALAWAWRHRVPANFPEVTGARRKVVLGAATA